MIMLERVFQVVVLLSIHQKIQLTLLKMKLLQEMFVVMAQRVVNYIFQDRLLNASVFATLG